MFTERPKPMHFQSETKREKRNGTLCGYVIWKVEIRSEWPNKEMLEKHSGKNWRQTMHLGTV